MDIGMEVKRFDHITFPEILSMDRFTYPKLISQQVSMPTGIKYVFFWDENAFRPKPEKFRGPKSA